MAMTSGDPRIRSGPDLTAADPGTAFARLFDENAGPLHRCLARRVGEHTAYDLLSETFLVALRQRHSYDPDRPVRGWLFGIATNLLRRHARDEIRALRATARVVDRRDDESGHEARVTEQIDAQVLARRLAPALAALSEPDRDVLLLTAWAGLTPAEVADALDVPAGTVRSRLHRVRRTLRAGHHREEPDEE